MKTFFYRFLIFALLAIVADQVTGAILRYFYFRQESGNESQAIYAIEKTMDPLLIFGSSRASHHYVPSILEKELDKSCYNTGREGNFILYGNAVLQAVLKRYKPEVILLDISQKEFQEYEASYDQLASLLPFYKAHPEIRETVALRGRGEKVKLLSAVYPFNSLIATILVGNLEFNKKRKADIRGYDPLYRTMSSPPELINNTGGYRIDSNKVKAYRQFVHSCKMNKIRLLVVCSPYYDKYASADTSVTLAAAIAREQGIPFFDFSQDTAYCGNARLFYDGNHLNHEAALRFTEEIAGLIKKTQIPEKE